MRYPNFNEEKKLWEKGYEIVVGLDEVGRGPMAGPVVAAAVMVKIPMTNYGRIQVWDLKNWDLIGHWSLGFGILAKEVNDSKLLSEKKREKLYKILTSCSSIGWGIGKVSEKIIDKINILEAAKLAMKKAVADLERKIGKRPDFLILDGNFKINSEIPQKSIIKGDQKVFSVAAASIIAKVYRDRLMKKYHKKYPQYGFDIHKGYPTKSHFEALEKFGPCKIHRKTFYPVKKYC